MFCLLSARHAQKGKEEGGYGEGRQFTFGDHERLKLALLGCTLHDLALDRVPADQPEDEHGSRLPDTVCSILCL